MIIYTKTVCPKCLLIKSVLNGNGVEHEIKNMDEDMEAREKVVSAGWSSAPVIEINGEMIGDFSEIQKRINELI